MKIAKIYLVNFVLAQKFLVTFRLLKNNYKNLPLKYLICQAVVVIPFNFSTWGNRLLRQGELWVWGQPGVLNKFQDSLCYTVKPCLERNKKVYVDLLCCYKLYKSYLISKFLFPKLCSNFLCPASFLTFVTLQRNLLIFLMSTSSEPCFDL